MSIGNTKANIHELISGTKSQIKQPVAIANVAAIRKDIRTVNSTNVAAIKGDNQTVKNRTASSTVITVAQSGVSSGKILFKSRDSITKPTGSKRSKHSGKLYSMKKKLLPIKYGSKTSCRYFKIVRRPKRSRKISSD